MHYVEFTQVKMTIWFQRGSLQRMFLLVTINKNKSKVKVKTEYVRTQKNFLKSGGAVVVRIVAKQKS